MPLYTEMRFECNLTKIGEGSELLLVILSVYQRSPDILSIFLHIKQLKVKKVKSSAHQSQPVAERSGRGAKAWPPQADLTPVGCQAVT